MPPKEINDECDSSKPINELSSAILLARAQREERLRKKAVKLGEDPDVFRGYPEEFAQHPHRKRAAEL